MGDKEDTRAMSSIYIPQNIQQFLKKLPTPIASLPILIIKRVGVENTVLLNLG